MTLIRLTQYSHGAGCGCKISLARFDDLTDLGKIVACKAYSKHESVLGLSGQAVKGNLGYSVNVAVEWQTTSPS